MNHAATLRPGALLLLATGSSTVWAQTSAAVCEADLRRHVWTLASDAMQGRSTGTPQAMEAARYLAAELTRMKVEPAGENGTYFQRVPMSRTEFLEIPRLACVAADGKPIAAVAGVDFDLSDGGGEARTLKLVFAKSAAEIPRQASLQSALVLLTASAKDRNEWLRTAGCPDGEGWGLLVTLGSEQPGSRALEKPPRSRSRVSSTPRISVRAGLRAAFEAGTPSELSFSAPIKTIELEAVNVVGKVVGVGSPQDAALAGELIEFSAHYDHLPPKEVEAGQDGIFNGADDDASGCAVVLELAEAFAAGPKPARTLLFFFATGEEIGLVGTRYSLEHPLVDLGKIVLDVNFEMLGRPDPLLVAPACMWLTGFDHSDLGPELQRLGLPVVADLRPEQNFFQRSDNYALAERGIVAQTLSSFGLHEDYHRVSDDPATIDYAHLNACAQAAWEGCRKIADGAFRPRWLEGMDPSKPKPKAKPAAKPTAPRDGDGGAKPPVKGS